MRRGTLTLAQLALLLQLLPAARAEVRLALRIPEAETYVLGDAIPLLWRFSNQSTQALGFMWEGCCRLNGRLEVRAVDRTLPTVPPGQALAHMFARADQLNPGEPKDYDTKISDWVKLPGTGTYEFRGTYRGVLPTQFPQVRRGLPLWRDAAESAPVRLSVLSVADYLGQREARAVRRGLRIAVSGPATLPPLTPVTFRVTFENPGREPQPLVWPDPVSLWVLDARDERVAPSAVITGVTESLVVPAGGRLEREFILGSDRFEGELLGTYRLFVDLAAEGDRPRAPSVAVPLDWRLSREQVVALVTEAARGARTGARNAPLKLLRLHLGELGEHFAALESAELPPGAGSLNRHLALASRLRPLQPKPGPIELRVGVGPPGPDGLTWAEEWVTRALRTSGSTGELPAQALEILSVQRHLGWEVSLGLVPVGVTMGRLWEVARALSGESFEFAGPLVALVPMPGTNAPARVALRLEPTAGVGPKLRVGPRGLDWSADGRTWEAVNAGAGWTNRLKAGDGPAVVPTLEAGEAVGWAEFVEAVRPLLQPGARLELSRTEPPPPRS